MKTYFIDVDITMSTTLEVDANNEQEAREKARESINNNPYDVIRLGGYYVSHEIIDVYDDEEQ